MRTVKKPYGGDRLGLPPSQRWPPVNMLNVNARPARRKLTAQKRSLGVSYGTPPARLRPFVICATRWHHALPAVPGLTPCDAVGTVEGTSSSP